MRTMTMVTTTTTTTTTTMRTRTRITTTTTKTTALPSPDAPNDAPTAVERAVGLAGAKGVHCINNQATAEPPTSRSASSPEEARDRGGAAMVDHQGADMEIPVVFSLVWAVSGAIGGASRRRAWRRA